MSDIPLRFLREVGTRAMLRVYWGDDCPNTYGLGGKGTHNAEIHLVDGDRIADWDLGGHVNDHPLACWPTKCDHCTAERPGLNVLGNCACEPKCALVTRQVHHRRIYSAPDGNLVDRQVLGDCYFCDWYHDRDGKCHQWDNCDGKHLIVIMDDDHPFDAMGRASNCTMKQDRTHRCWVVQGNPDKGEIVTVGKGGHTCSAGAGSIQLRNWHGFIENGKIVKR